MTATAPPPSMRSSSVTLCLSLPKAAAPHRPRFIQGVAASDPDRMVVRVCLVALAVLPFIL